MKQVLYSRGLVFKEKLKNNTLKKENPANCAIPANCQLFCNIIAWSVHKID